MGHFQQREARDMGHYYMVFLPIRIFESQLQQVNELKIAKIDAKIFLTRWPKAKQTN